MASLAELRESIVNGQRERARELIGALLQSGGFKVVDIGVDVSTDKFVEAVKREQPDILGLSALLTMTMPRMREVIEALKKSNLRDKVRVMVGGASLTQEFADSIGADTYAADAISTGQSPNSCLRRKSLFRLCKACSYHFDEPWHKPEGSSMIY